MKAESSTYVELQNLYRNKARRDATLVHENVKALLLDLGRDPESVSFEEVSLFTKHSNFLRLVNYRTLASEYTLPADEHHKKAVSNALRFEEDSPIHDYIAVRAWQEFYTNRSRLAGAEDARLQGDLAALTGIAGGYLGALGYGGILAKRSLAMLREVARAGGGELHVIASLAGGIVAQEIVKVSARVFAKDEF